MTPAEHLLWSRLRRDALGFHFRHQAPLGNYILDFYCASEMLAVEVDGDVHAGREELDAERTAWLEREKNIRILRVTNNDVFTNLEGVPTFIRNELLAPSPALPR